MSLQKKCQICRKNISNGERCKNCLDVVPTHILIDYPDLKAATLFRACDGMGICQRNSVVCVIGENKNNNVSRIFTDIDKAEAFMRDVICVFDLAGQDIKPAEGKGYHDQLAAALSALGDRKVILEVRDGAKGLVLPATAEEMPGSIKAFRH